MKFKKFVLKNYPTNDFPQDLSCFELKHDAQLDQSMVKEGESLIKIFWVSVDPLLRTWISGAKSYIESVGPGSSIPGFGIAKIIKIIKKAGKKTFLEQDDWVFGMLEWSQYAIIDNKNIQKLPIVTNHLSQDLQGESYKFLSIYGPSGFTSFCSIKKQIEPFSIYNQKLKRNKKPQEMNIVISSAGGGIGLTVAEYLSKMGYTNLFGIAGTDQKCNVARSVGFKNAINYKNYYKNGDINATQFETGVRNMLGGQDIDLYYENVGEDMLSSMLNLMAVNSKIIMCGATATYNSWGDKVGVRNFGQIISRRVQMKGILYFDQKPDDKVKMFMQMLNVQIKGVDVIVKGMQNLPLSYRDMINGKYIGKPIVQFVDQI